MAVMHKKINCNIASIIVQSNSAIKTFSIPRDDKISCQLQKIHTKVVKNVKITSKSLIAIKPTKVFKRNSTYKRCQLQ